MLAGLVLRPRTSILTRMPVLSAGLSRLLVWAGRWRSQRASPRRNMSVTDLDGRDSNGLSLSYLGQATGKDDGLGRIRAAVESADGLLGFIEADV